MTKKALNVIGLMSGTSFDGIDVSLLRTDGDRFIERGPSLMVPYDQNFQSQLRQGLIDAQNLANRAERPGCLQGLEADITTRHAQAVKYFLERHRLRITDIDLIGFHGQTICHRPDIAVTVQLGDGQELADIVGVKVAYDMRANDMAHGGQGAPLSPIYHQALAGQLGDTLRAKGVCFLNIGGISNVTFVSSSHELQAFDCGPGNMLIDQWVALNSDMTYDDNGSLSQKGQRIDRYAQPYLALGRDILKSSRSIDKLDFPPLTDDCLSLEDGARTLCCVTAELIAMAAQIFQVAAPTWIVCGGGRRNRTLLDELQNALGPSSHILTAEMVGLDGDGMEAEAWAYLAARVFYGLPITFPGTTQVSRPLTGGILSR